MSERSRSTFLLGCFGLAVLYLPDCARILAGQEGPQGIVHAGAPLAAAPNEDGLAADSQRATDEAVAVVQEEYGGQEDYVGGE